MNTMKVEVLEKVLRGKDRETGKHYDLVEGDRATVSEPCGRAWCAHGWVKDVDGNVETGERVVRGRKVKPDNIKVASKAKEL